MKQQTNKSITFSLFFLLTAMGYSLPHNVVAATSTKYPLTIKATPQDAQIRILNIGPKYRDKIMLRPWRYHIEVSKSGFKTHKEWITLPSKETVHLVKLQSLATPAKPVTPLENAKPKSQGKPTSKVAKTTPKADSKPQKISKKNSTVTATRGKAWIDPTTQMEFVWVPKGCFEMGSNSGEPDEQPVHKVCLSNGYWLGKYEITIAQFKMFTSATNYKGKKGYEVKCKDTAMADGLSQTDNDPVVCITWKDAKAFADWLTQKGGKNYRLPTEAEWEYACRSGGKNQKYCGGNSADAVGWYSTNSGNKTHPVGGKTKNDLGLYDMSGNVCEWVQDRYNNKYYRHKSAKKDPQGPKKGSMRIFRGGSWNNDAGYALATYRDWNAPTDRYNRVGARLMMQP